MDLKLLEGGMDKSSGAGNRDWEKRGMQQIVYS